MVNINLELSAEANKNLRKYMAEHDHPSKESSLNEILEGLNNGK